MADTSKKCAHPACSCIVDDAAHNNGKYCSTYCHDAGSDSVELSCDCGHPGCSLS